MVAARIVRIGGSTMRKFRIVAASLAALTVAALSPAAAWADACNQCFGGCIDAYGDDGSESGFHALSQCFNSCTNENGFRCMDQV
jgi:hypothetical protein